MKKGISKSKNVTISFCRQKKFKNYLFFAFDLKAKHPLDDRRVTCIVNEEKGLVKGFLATDLFIWEDIIGQEFIKLLTK